MITRLAHGLNAAIFGSLAYMATSFVPVAQSPVSSGGQTTISTRSAVTQPVSPVRTVTELASPVRTVSERPSPVQTVSELPLPAVATGKPTPAVPAPVISQAEPTREPGAPRLFSPSSPLIPLASNGAPYLAVPQGKTIAQADPIIPPIARKRPSSGTTVAAERKTKQKQPTTTVAEQADRPAGSAKSKPAKSTTVAAAPKRDIDLTGRSALGAAPTPAAPRCAADQKFDVKAQKCTKTPPAQVNTTR